MLKLTLAGYTYTRPLCEEFYYSHVEVLFAFMKWWLYCETTPVPRCMSAWCPTCNTPGLFWLCWDPTNGPRLPVHVRCLICMILAFFADSAMILVLLHV